MEREIDMDFKQIKRIARRKANFIGAPIYRYVSSDYNRMRIEYTNHYENSPIVEKTILFESRDGQSFTDSPYAMYKQMVRDSRFADYRFYWVYKKDYALDELKRNFTVEEVEHAIFVERDSKEYARLLATVQYLITNSTFQSFYIKKEGQTYINTWHGTPLKTMGFDIPDDPFASQNVLRNFLMADYILSPNEHTSQIFIDSYKLRGLYSGEVVESGYPRIDLTLNTTREEVLLKLRLANVKIDDTKKIVMYTPTWKGSAVGNPNVNMDQMLAEIALLEAHCSDQYNVLVKVHPFVYNKVKDLDVLQGKLIPDYYDANEMMAAADILITDYSSIFFDYLVTDKPIIFYAWDKDMYQNDRGMYLDESELPGPVLSTIFEVIDAVRHIDEYQAQYANNYQAMKAKMVNYDNGLATERYLDYLFGSGSDVKVYRPFEDKHHIIMYPGGMFNNGITTSVLNLLNNIDYDQYDVTLLCSTRKNKEVLNNLNKVNPHVRLMFKIGTGDYTIEEQYLDRLLQNRSVTPELKPYYPEKAYQREARRLSGACHFESAIDFSGYSYFWAKYIVGMDADCKVAFQHNDLASDAKREVHGKHPHFINLRGMFSLYYKFDVLLSVSPITRDINLEKLSAYAEPEKFQYCINTINPDKILAVPEVVTEEEKLEFHKMTQPMRVIKNATYTLVPDISRLDIQYKLSIDESQEIYALMETEILDEKLVKVLIDNVYCGWMNADLLEPTLDKVLKTSVVDRYARITNVRNHAIYSAPYNTEEGMVRKAALGYLKNVLVYIDQAVETPRATYVHMWIDQHDIGWTEIEAVKYVAGLEMAQVAQNHLLHRQVIETMPFYSESQQLIGRINKMLPAIYDHELGHRDAEVKDEFYHSNLKDKLVYVDWKMETAAGVSYKIRTKDDLTGWISADDLTVYDLEEAPMVLYQETVASKDQMIPKTTKALLFATLDKLAQSELTDESPRQLAYQEMPAKLYMNRRLWTKVGLVIEFIDENQEVIGYGHQSSFETLEGLTDIYHNPVEIDQNKLNFVSMGRLSPEKNQTELVQAVRQIVSARPELADKIHLYILGSGALQEQLEAEISEYGLAKNVTLLGQKENPFTVLKDCDCFVLSSVYEGQPMVLLEALTLGMDIIATNIPANCYVLEDGAYGLLTEGTTADDLAKTMNEYIDKRDQLSFKHFDYEAYNQKAIQNFYDKI